MFRVHTCSTNKTYTYIYLRMFVTLKNDNCARWVIGIRFDVVIQSVNLFLNVLGDIDD
jgi:hypothetical protein